MFEVTIPFISKTNAAAAKIRSNRNIVSKLSKLLWCKVVPMLREVFIIQKYQQFGDLVASYRKYLEAFVVVFFVLLFFQNSQCVFFRVHDLMIMRRIWFFSPSEQMEYFFLHKFNSCRTFLCLAFQKVCNTRHPALLLIMVLTGLKMISLNILNHS